MKTSLAKIIARLPETPGVYLFQDQRGRTLYVGKAVNLRRRVRAYFENQNFQADRLTFFPAMSEAEALLREAELIKKLKPLFNVRFKDDKFYPFLKISKEEFPSLTKVHRKAGAGRYFGPYPLGNVPLILKALRRIFPFRDCSSAKFRRQKKLQHPCLYGDLKLCPAPCVGAITEPLYRQHLRYLAAFLRGKKEKVLASLQGEMEKASFSQEFEKAAFLRDEWRRLCRLETAPERPARQLTDGEGRGFPVRLEAYDLSHLAATAAVGSMVVFRRGQPEKSSYRRFRIKVSTPGDDCAMLKEVLRRRFANPALGPFPDLILLDGGRGQLAAALRVERELKLEIPAVALAKRKEEIYHCSFVRKKIVKVKLPAESPVLQFLQRARDEAHRFARSYHHHLHRRRSGL